MHALLERPSPASDVVLVWCCLKNVRIGQSVRVRVGLIALERLVHSIFVRCTQEVDLLPWELVYAGNNIV